jgi:hypothetical protein
MTKTYTGFRQRDAEGRSTHTVVTVLEEGKEPRPLDPRLDLRNHSPTGLEWGYGGSGPAQLALALAADVLGDDDLAESVYQRLKFKLIARLPEDGWRLSEEQLRQAIRDVQARDRGGQSR